ncbi:MAG: hypothetical protein JXQ87_09015 [Bacteroidia bacterium]
MVDWLWLFLDRFFGITKQIADFFYFPQFVDYSTNIKVVLWVALVGFVLTLIYRAINGLEISVISIFAHMIMAFGYSFLGLFLIGVGFHVLIILLACGLLTLIFMLPVYLVIGGVTKLTKYLLKPS